MSYLDSTVADFDKAVRCSGKDINTALVFAILIPGDTLPGQDRKFLRRVLLPEVGFLTVNLEGGNASGR